MAVVHVHTMRRSCLTLMYQSSSTVTRTILKVLFAFFKITVDPKELDVW